MDFQLRKVGDRSTGEASREQLLAEARAKRDARKSKSSQLAAAKLIQRMWRGHRERLRVVTQVRAAPGLCRSALGAQPSLEYLLHSPR